MNQLKVVQSIGLIIALLVFAVLFTRHNKLPRTLDAEPVIEELSENEVSPSLQANFFLDTSGDQGCFFRCPETGLGVMATKNNTRVTQIFRSCDQVGIGDPFSEGALCDGKKLLLKIEDSIDNSQVVVLSEELGLPVLIVTVPPEYHSYAFPSPDIDQWSTYESKKLGISLRLPAEVAIEDLIVRKGVGLRFFSLASEPELEIMQPLGGVEGYGTEIPGFPDKVLPSQKERSIRGYDSDDVTDVMYYVLLTDNRQPEHNWAAFAFIEKSLLTPELISTFDAIVSSFRQID